MKDKNQPTLFKVEEEWEKHWQDMPEYSHEDLTSFKKIIIHFRNLEDLKSFAKLVDQHITPLTQSIWYPKAEIDRMVDKVYKSES